MLDARDIGRESDEDEVKRTVRKKPSGPGSSANSISSQPSSALTAFTWSGSIVLNIFYDESRTQKYQEWFPRKPMLRKHETIRNEKRRQQEIVLKKLVNAMTMMIREEVDIESGHSCRVLVKENWNHNEMTEKAGSGNGAEVSKLVKDICRWERKNLLANKVVVKASCRGDGNLGETKFKGVTWQTSEEKNKRRTDTWTEQHVRRE